MSVRSLVLRVVFLLLVVGCFFATNIIFPYDHPGNLFTALGLAVVAAVVCMCSWFGKKWRLLIALWLILHIGVYVLGAYVAEPWVDTAGYIINLWLPGVLAFLAACLRFFGK